MVADPYILNDITTTRFAYTGVQWQEDNDLSKCDPPVCGHITRPYYCLTDDGSVYVTTQDGYVYYLDSDEEELRQVYPNRMILSQEKGTPDAPQTSDDNCPPPTPTSITLCWKSNTAPSSDFHYVIGTKIGDGVYPWRPGRAGCFYDLEANPNTNQGILEPAPDYTGNPKLPDLMELPFVNGYYVVQNGYNHCVVFYRGVQIYDGLFNGSGIPLTFAYGTESCLNSDGCCSVTASLTWTQQRFQKWAHYGTSTNEFRAFSIWDKAISDMGVDRHGKITVGNVVHSSKDDAGFDASQDIPKLTVLPFIVSDWGVEQSGQGLYKCIVSGGKEPDLSALKAWFSKEIDQAKKNVDECVEKINAFPPECKSLPPENPESDTKCAGYEQLQLELETKNAELALWEKRLRFATYTEEVSAQYQQYGFVVVNDDGQITGAIENAAPEGMEDEVGVINAILTSLVGNRVLWSLGRRYRWAKPTKEEQIGEPALSCDYDYLYTCTESREERVCETGAATPHHKTWYFGPMLRVVEGTTGIFDVSNWKEECCRRCSTDAQPPNDSWDSIYKCGGSDCGKDLKAPDTCNSCYPLSVDQEPRWVHNPPESCEDEADMDVRDTVLCQGEVAQARLEPLGGRVFPIYGAKNHYTKLPERTNWGYIYRSFPTCPARKEWTVIGEIKKLDDLPGILPLTAWTDYGHDPNNIDGDNIDLVPTSISYSKAFVLRAPRSFAGDHKVGFSVAFPLESDPTEVKKEFTRFYPAYLSRPGYRFGNIANYEQMVEFYDAQSYTPPPPPADDEPDENGIIWDFKGFSSDLTSVTWTARKSKKKSDPIPDRVMRMPTPLLSDIKLDSSEKPMSYASTKDAPSTVTAGKWYRGQVVADIQLAIAATPENPSGIVRMPSSTTDGSTTTDPDEPTKSTMTSGVYWKQAVKSWGDPDGIPIRIGLNVGDIFYSKDGFDDTNWEKIDGEEPIPEKQDKWQDRYWLWNGCNWKLGSLRFSELFNKQEPEWVIFYRDQGEGVVLDHPYDSKSVDWETCVGNRAVFIGRVVNHRACGAILAINFNTDVVAQTNNYKALVSDQLTDTIPTSFAPYHKCLILNEKVLWERPAFGPVYSSNNLPMYEGMTCLADTYVLVTYNSQDDKQIFRLWLMGGFSSDDPRTQKREIYDDYQAEFNYEDVPDITKVKPTWVTNDLIRKHGNAALKKYLLIPSRGRYTDENGEEHNPKKWYLFYGFGKDSSAYSSDDQTMLIHTYYGTPPDDSASTPAGYSESEALADTGEGCMGGSRIMVVRKAGLDVDNLPKYDIWLDGERIQTNMACNLYCGGMIVEMKTPLWEYGSVMVRWAYVLPTGDELRWVYVDNSGVCQYMFAGKLRSSQLVYTADNQSVSRYEAYYIGTCDAPDTCPPFTHLHKPEGVETCAFELYPEHDTWTAEYKVYLFDYLTETVADMCDVSLQLPTPLSYHECIVESNGFVDANLNTFCNSRGCITLGEPINDGLYGRSIQCVNFHSPDYNATRCEPGYPSATFSITSLWYDGVLGTGICGITGIWNDGTVKFYPYQQCEGTTFTERDPKYHDTVTFCASGSNSSVPLGFTPKDSDYCVFTYDAPNGFIVYEDKSARSGTVACRKEPILECGKYAVYEVNNLADPQYETYYLGTKLSTSALLKWCCSRKPHPYGDYAFFEDGTLWYNGVKLTLLSTSDDANYGEIFKCCGDALLCTLPNKTSEDSSSNKDLNTDSPDNQDSSGVQYFYIEGTLIKTLEYETKDEKYSLMCCGVDYYLLQSGSFHFPVEFSESESDAAVGDTRMVGSHIATLESISQYSVAGPDNTTRTYTRPKTWKVELYGSDGSQVSVRFPHDMTYAFMPPITDGSVNTTLVGTRSGFVPWSDQFVGNRKAFTFYKTNQISDDPRIHSIECFRYRNIGSELVPDYRAIAAFAVFYDDPRNFVKEDSYFTWMTGTSPDTVDHEKWIRTQSCVKNIFKFYDPVTSVEEKMFSSDSSSQGHFGSPCNCEDRSTVRNAFPNVCIQVWEKVTCVSNVNHDLDRPFIPFCDSIQYKTASGEDGEVDLTVYRDSVIYINDYNAAARWDRLSNAEPVDEWQEYCYADSAGTGGFWISAPTFNVSMSPDNNPYDSTGRLVVSGNSSIFVWDAHHGRLEYNALTGQRVIREEYNE